jgi:hypothetical protein
MKTQVMTFKISNSFTEWVRHFGSHAVKQKAAGMTPIFRGPHEDDPQKVCIVIQINDDAKADAFMQEHEAEILESGHILETTEVNIYL